MFDIDDTLKISDFIEARILKDINPYMSPEMIKFRIPSTRATNENIQITSKTDIW